MRSILLITVIIFISNFIVFGQCADSSNIHSFTFNGNRYEVIRENQTWVNAAACAVERGGILTEIDDVNEQNAIFSELQSNANINTLNTIAPDGGGASYVWIGGNDLTTEGNWVWNGNNDSISTQFWMGTSTGTPIGGLYNNWGNEPDDFFGQDALGLALTNWPLGVAGQWNDVNELNSLYYVVEFSPILGTSMNKFDHSIQVYPNPVEDFVIVENEHTNLGQVIITNALGDKIQSIKVENSTSLRIDLSNLNEGVYFLEIYDTSGRFTTRKIMK